jgi:hypothetical protein
VSIRQNLVRRIGRRCRWASPFTPDDIFDQLPLTVVPQHATLTQTELDSASSLDAACDKSFLPFRVSDPELLDRYLDSGISVGCLHRSNLDGGCGLEA